MTPRPSPEADSRVAAPPLSTRAAFKSTLQVLVLQVITLGASFSQLYLAQRCWGDVGLDFFTQWRRLLALLVPVSLLGHGISLARELGRAHDDSAKRAAVVSSSFLLIAVLLACLGAAMILLPDLAARYVLGVRRFAPLAGALGLALVGEGLATLLATYWRGRFRFLYAALLNLTIVGLVPAVGLIAFSRADPVLGIWIMSAAKLVIAGSLLSWVFLRFLRRGNRLSASVVLRENWLLTRYGLARMPMLVAAAVLNGFGSWQLARQQLFGHLGVYNSLTQIAHATNIASAAIAFTLLPVLSAVLKKGDRQSASRTMSVLIHAAVAFATFMGLQLAVFGPGVGQMVLGRRLDIQSLLWGGIFLTIIGRFIAGIIRNPLDAFSAIPYHLISYAAALGGLFVAWYTCTAAGMEPLAALVTAYVVAFAVQAAVCIVLAKVIFHVPLADRRSLAALVIIALLGLLALIEREFVRYNAYMSVLWLAVNSLLVAAAMLGIKPPWLMTILSRLRSRARKPAQPLKA